MSDVSYVKTKCTHCGGAIEFPKDSVGETTACPHCGQETQLIARAGLSKTAWVLIAVWIIMVFGGMAAMVVFAPWKQKLDSKQETNVVNVEISKAGPVTKDGFEVGEIGIQKTEGGGLVYAAGSLRNQKEQQRFGVTVELDLFDTGGTKIGTATDYAGVIEPGAVWNFRALVTEPATVSAKVAGIREDK